MTEAMRRARGAVKEELKREKIRLADVEAREISERARHYIEAHPELIDDAACTIRDWFARGVFGKRAGLILAKLAGGGVVPAFTAMRL